MEKKSIKGNGVISDSLKSAVFAVLISLILTLIMSIVVHFVSIDVGIVNIINIAIRIVSILLGLLIGVKQPSKGILKGNIVSVLYILLTYVLFGIIASDFSLKASMLIDSGSAFIAGVVSGIIAVNVKSK